MGQIKNLMKLFVIWNYIIYLTTRRIGISSNDLEMNGPEFKKEF